MKAIETVCVRLEETKPSKNLPGVSRSWNYREVTVEDVKNTMIITSLLTKQKREDQHQQEKDRISFAVVLGVCLSPRGHVLEAIRNQGTRACLTGASRGCRSGGRGRGTGLMAVGSDVLTIVSAFFEWDKVELHRELDLQGGMGQNKCLFSPCGNFILSSSCNGDAVTSEFRLWGATSGDLLRGGGWDYQEGEYKLWGTTAVSVLSHDCCFFPDGKTIVSADDDHKLRLWNVECGTLSSTLEGHTGPVSCVDVSPDGTHILSGSEDGTVRLWNFTADANFAGVDMLECTLPLVTGKCFCCSFSPNGALFLFGDGASLKLGNPTTYQLQHTLTGHSRTVKTCSFAPDGVSILSGSFDGTLKLWHATTGGLLRTLYGHTNFYEGSPMKVECETADCGTLESFI
jgi:WD40 repeat protein